MSPTQDCSLSPDVAKIDLSIEGGLRFTAQQIALYDSCPRRFFYSYVLEVGGRRSMTPFMLMHEAVRSVFQSIIESAPPIGSDGEIDERVMKALAKQGLGEHGYLADYKTLAVAMIKYFNSTRQGLIPKTRNALLLTFGQEQIIVFPDDVLVSNGNLILRRIKTGHHRKSDQDDMAAAAFVLAAQEAFPGAAVEIIYLSDQVSQALSLSPRQLKNRRDKLVSFFQKIRAGSFPASPSQRVCPQCPAFFICGSTPLGPLPKKFQ